MTRRRRTPHPLIGKAIAFWSRDPDQHGHRLALVERVVRRRGGGFDVVARWPNVKVDPGGGLSVTWKGRGRIRIPQEDLFPKRKPAETWRGRRLPAREVGGARVQVDGTQVPFRDFMEWAADQPGGEIP